MDKCRGAMVVVICADLQVEISKHLNKKCSISKWKIASGDTSLEHAVPDEDVLADIASPGKTPLTDCQNWPELQPCERLHGAPWDP